MISPLTHEEIALVFAQQKWAWKGKTPTSDDVRETIRALWEAIKDLDSGTQIESGRLLVRKLDDDDYDVFLNFGRE